MLVTGSNPICSVHFIQGPMGIKSRLGESRRHHANRREIRGGQLVRLDLPDHFVDARARFLANLHPPHQRRKRFVPRTRWRVDKSQGVHQRFAGIGDLHPVGALTGNPGIASYIASKHGVVGLTRTAALEYVKRGIRVNAVNPGLIDTQIARDVVNGDEQAYAELAKQVPIGRAGTPDEIASVVLWLCSPGASYVVGHALTVDGGMTVV
jgi:NAD(P)-dependent dehydrogenase (short-subunit alcohol dehydrogenase family)